MPPLKIEMWSDLVCPFCWIGKRHMEEAIRRLGLADDVEIVHRAFELNPQAQEPRPVHEYLAQRYGGGMEGARAMTARTAAMGAAAGLAFDFDRALASRTFDAHRVVHLAREQGVEDAVVERLMRAHFSEGADLSDAATLRRLGTEAGLDAAAVDEVLSSDKHAAQVRAEEREAQTLGARGVPFFVIDRRLGIVGAQPVDAFVEALQQAARAR